MRDQPSQQVASRIEGVHKAMPLAGDVIVAGGIPHGERDIENAAKVLNVEGCVVRRDFRIGEGAGRTEVAIDRKSTRLNSSHSQISYAVFCLTKKKKQLRHFPHPRLRMTLGDACATACPPLRISTRCCHVLSVGLPPLTHKRMRIVAVYTTSY